MGRVVRKGMLEGDRDLMSDPVEKLMACVSVYVRLGVLTRSLGKDGRAAFGTEI